MSRLPHIIHRITSQRSNNKAAHKHLTNNYLRINSISVERPTRVTTDLANPNFPLHCSDDMEGRKIRIPGHVWNAYQPKSAPRLKLKLKLKSTEATKEPTTQCKTKLFRFHPGGPHRQQKGQWQNEITLEQPCLQPTCPTCWKWHPHVLGHLHHPQLNKRPEQEPISPDIDPRILDGSWKLCEHAPSPGPISAASSSPIQDTSDMPVLTLVTPSSPQPQYQHQPCSIPRYDVLLRTPVVRQAISGAPARTKWTALPRKRWTVRLGFGSCEGREGFGGLVRGREGRERKREYDRVRRARVREGRGM
ncbi:hypothetical protein BDW02DRAFT_566102 [Decorospora gaudefroyi]|uniref:Uncharacterized protein n=1 Tax=Decorospora gaudefroyi TaxID=184978 RepID=A0A6A5KSL0_9PLEO|nr:hypothetical protein BDW02DRAFT_566102 [Decorospora gaudefroyi]